MSILNIKHCNMTYDKIIIKDSELSTLCKAGKLARLESPTDFISATHRLKVKQANYEITQIVESDCVEDYDSSNPIHIALIKEYSKNHL